MKYSIKPKNDSDKENAQQLELIMNHKSATYDDISEVIKEQVDNFELKYNIIEERLSMQSLIKFEEECLFKEKISIDDINKFSKYYVDNFLGKDVKIFKKHKVSKDTPQIIDAIIFQEEKQPKENHPHGWYRKFEKKRY